MLRKIAILVAAIIVPGGLIALLGAVLYRAIQRTERGRKVIDMARQRAPSFPAYLRGHGQRQAA